MSFRCENVCFAYNRVAGRERVEVLRNFSATIPRGAIAAVVGSSGTGKSTLLSLLGLLWEPNRRSPQSCTVTGDIAYLDDNGEEHLYSSLCPERAADIRRRKFGFAFQASHLLPNLSCIENVSVPLGLLGFDEEERRCRAEKLFYGDLRDRVDTPVNAISGGQRQRIALMRSIVHDPDVVFADEPFSQLDGRNRELIMEMLVSWHRGSLSAAASSRSRTLVFVCHDPTIAMRFGTCLLQLHEACGYGIDRIE